MRTIKLLSTLVLLTLSLGLQAMEYHVSKSGNDTSVGTKDAPLKTISRAAKIAIAGDVIIVHEGIYRERIDPAYGGLNNFQRVTYKAADNEDVSIRGSEQITTWEKYKKGVWKVTLDNKMFGEFNPYKELIYGDWIVDTYGKDNHLGEVYINGKALFENDDIAKLLAAKPMERAKDQEASKYQWYCESDDNTTTIYANFGKLNPNTEMAEITVRPVVFYPRKTGIDYITVSGFTLCHAATQWAPPTAEQQGLIGPHWSKGWIIENNLITDSKCTGISLGKERASGHNDWSKYKKKQGTQTERDVIFKALQLGWSRETIGSHIVRNNVIRDCEQTGICGHLGCIFSQIYDNHIYNIHRKGQVYGFETGGIKLHAAIDVLIEGNCIHDCDKGIWLDWQAQNARVSGNVFFNNWREDFFTEVCQGPLLVDNNVMLSEVSILNASQGSAFVHNILAGNLSMRLAPGRFTPYHFPHSTSVAGLMNILLGDDRFYNNILSSEVLTKGGKPYTGTNAYDEHPLDTAVWYVGKTPNDFLKHKLPVFIESNLYYNEALPFNREKHAIVNENHNPNLSIEQDGDAFYLNITLDDNYDKVNTQLVNTSLLGVAFESNMPFENNDASPLAVDQDLLGQMRDLNQPKVGPFESLKAGKNRIKVFEE